MDIAMDQSIDLHTQTPTAPPFLTFGINRILSAQPSDELSLKRNATSELISTSDKDKVEAKICDVKADNSKRSAMMSPGSALTSHVNVLSPAAESRETINTPHSQSNSSTEMLSMIAKAPFPIMQSFLMKPSMERLRHKVYSSGEFRRVGHPYSNRTPPKRKKPRTTFSREQIAELEMRFNGQKYLASTERLRLAKQLQLSDSQVKTWFQNRRTKWRRQSAEEREAERNAATKYLLKIQQNAAVVAAGAAFWPSLLAFQQTPNYSVAAVGLPPAINIEGKSDQ